LKFLLLIILCTLIKAESWRGWDELVKRLESDGISQETLRSLYKSDEFPEFFQVPFRITPVESPTMYGQFTNLSRLVRAQEFLKKNKKELNKAYLHYGVEPEIITAILYVETDLGRNLGSELVLNRLSRIANIGTEENIVWNYKRLREQDDSVTLEKVRDRAGYLTTTFYPEVRILLELHEKGELDAKTLKGSNAGAFGIPQFLPSSYRDHAVDGNKNGIVSLFELEDAIWSVASYFKAHGWRKGISYPEKRKVIWAYNKSDAYIDTILKVATILKHSPHA
jgi:membrane-bound lytic murein transglycosylase B